MNIEYRRTVRGSFMILEGREKPAGYEKEMLKQNDIPQLLRFHTLELNGKTQFWYDIGGLRSFRDMMMCDGITAERLSELFFAIKDSYQRLSKFLIDEEHILLHPDALFFEKRGESLRSMLCFCPVDHEDVREQLRELMRFVIAEVDHSRSRDTAICYELNAITEREEFSFYDLTGYLNGECETEEDFWRPHEISPQKEEMPVIHEDEEPQPQQPKKKKSGIVTGIIGRIKTGITDLLPGVFRGRRKLLPEKKPFKDIEFDEVRGREEETVLLSEDNDSCSGKLLYESGGRGGCDLVVDKNPFSIGSRTGGNDAILSSEAVSRYHARIYRRDGGFFVEDLNSRNGTYVNGEILPYHKPRKLKRMDMISFADVVYRMV